MLAYPLQVCLQPIAIEVATIDGVPVMPDSRFPIYDPALGFTCVNPPLISWLVWKWWCQDYKVRFTCPRSFCQPKCVTNWFDTDDPDTNGGDYESLYSIFNAYPGETPVCQNPIAIEVQTISGGPVVQTDNNIELSVSAYGFSCTYIKPAFCADYKVRFICPDKWCSACRTPWFDHDNPDKDGDWETLSSILLAYPLQVCLQPIAIEVATISGVPVWPNGHFSIFDPKQGFACVNQPLLGWWWWKWCKDYKVRFTCPTSFCQPKCVTRWFDYDDPSKGGDFELLTTLQSVFPGEICPNPIGIQAQTISGQPAYQTGNYIHLSISASGFSCTSLKPKLCADYKVRFTCPDEWCSRCRTPWLDRDDPSGGDNEMLTLLLKENPLKICPKPIAIEVTTISGTPALPPGNIFVTYDPLLGFECKNGACADYKIRFTCPSSFCNTTCVTRWFDSDDPKTNGSDSELLSDLLSKYPGQICTNPVGIEAQTISGVPAHTTGNVIQVYDADTGFLCVNAAQTGGVACADYKVRFLCPETFCSSCRTPWIDKDDPDNPGDIETWKDVCTSKVSYLPIAIEVVTTASESPALLTGNLFNVFDPLEGFECRNDQQVCLDYKVRYTCPKTFCENIVNPKLTNEITNMTMFLV